MQSPRNVLTPDALSMLQTVADEGSFAAAARALGLVPSALTYRVRLIEDALDVLLFDRSSRQARVTEAGAELLRQGARLLQEVDAVANRVKRVATGWEPQFTIAVDTIISASTLMELVEAFLQQVPSPPTRIRLRNEALSGTLAALTSGRADLALGVSLQANMAAGLQSKPLGPIEFVFAVAPHHPLAKIAEPLTDELRHQYRAVAVADSAIDGSALTFGLLGGQDVLTVATMGAKLDAQLCGLGVGFLPQKIAAPYLDSGQLVAKQVVHSDRRVLTSYAWRSVTNPGRAMRWWLEQLQSPTTRAALLERHAATRLAHRVESTTSPTRKRRP